MLQLKSIRKGIYRIYDPDRTPGLLSRYGFLNEESEAGHQAEREASFAENASEVCNSIHVSKQDDTYLFDTIKKQLTVKALPATQGFRIEITLAEKERLFGLGDALGVGEAGRTRLMRRGSIAQMNIKNVVGYAPIPFLMSSLGWGIFTNCTFPHTYDMGCSDEDKLVITAKKGALDFYIFIGGSMAELLDLYTGLTGRPILLPKFAYGFTFVENEQTDERGLLWDIRTMRDRDIPCDVMGLEPNWMSEYYDYSIHKSWNKKDFYLPYWLPDNQSGSFTFFYAMRQMGMQLSLWLCQDYDLLWEEERQAIRRAAREKANISMQAAMSDVDRDTDLALAEIDDPHLEGDIISDKVTKIDEPWFEHLKKFVDNGTAAFKLDGANQVLSHPDRLWAGRYPDEEVHNVYPVILAKQMQQGYKDYTDRRAFIYSAGGYAGIQHYAATWAGDTGGDWKAVMSIFNHAMSGHTNASCDMEVSDPLAIHCGFLLPWAQQLGWSNWRHPWFLSPDKEEMIRFYGKLRSSLFPYLYAMAHKAAATGMPIVRPLPLVYEDTDAFDDCFNLYMLGDSLLVGAFDMHFHLPEGVWIDYWTGREYSGEVTYEIPAGRGGALFVKKGSVLVTMTPQKYLLEKEHDYIIDIYPGEGADFTLIEDDGFTYDYLEGKCAKTRIELSEESEEGFRVIVKKRTGSFAGRPDNGHHMEKNSIPKIKGLQPVRDMRMVIHKADISAITMNGEAVEASCGVMKEPTETIHGASGKAEIMIPASLHEAGDIVIEVKF